MCAQSRIGNSRSLIHTMGPDRAMFTPLVSSSRAHPGWSARRDQNSRIAHDLRPSPLPAPDKPKFRAESSNASNERNHAMSHRLAPSRPKPDQVMAHMVADYVSPYAITTTIRTRPAHYSTPARHLGAAFAALSYPAVRSCSANLPERSFPTAAKVPWHGVPLDPVSGPAFSASAR